MIGRPFSSIPPLIPLSLMVACGSSDSSGPLIEVTLEELIFSPSMPSVIVGETIEIEVLGRYSDESEASLTEDASWSVEDLTILQRRVGNQFRGLSEGQTSVTARADGQTAMVTVSVLPSPLESIQVNPPSVTVEVNEQLRLTAIGQFRNGRRVAVEEMIEWSSADPSIAAMNGNELTGVAPGTTEITGRQGEVSDTLIVTVQVPRLESLEVGPELMDVPAGDEVQLFATGLLTSGATTAFAGRVAWSSADTSVAVVSNEEGSRGLLRAVGEGQTEITARNATANVSASVRVSVAAPILRRLELTPASASGPAGQIILVGALGIFSDGSIENYSNLVSWTSSDPSVGRVSTQPPNAGQTELLSEGVTTISAVHEPTGITTEESGGSAQITVTPPEIVSITILPRTAEVAAGLSRQFEASGSFTDGANRDVTNMISWATTNAMVASVDANGLVTTRAPGNVRVVATDPVTGVSSGAASADLSIGPPNLLSIEVTPTRLNIAQVGGLGALRANGAFTDGMTRNISGLVRWTSSRPSTIQAIPGSPGQVRSATTGVARIQATDLATGISGEALVSSGVTLAALAVTPTTAEIPVGAEVALRADGVYSDGSRFDFSELVTWSSSRPAVADVGSAGTRTGVVVSVTSGRTNITANDSFSGTSATATVSTNAATLTRLSVSLPQSELTVSTSLEASALGTFSDSQTYAMTHVVNWSSSDTSVATISSGGSTAGLIQSVGAGTTVISAADPSSGRGSTANPTLTVRPAVVAGRWTGPTVTVDNSGNFGTNVGSVTFSASDFGSSSPRITDVNIAIDFRKTDGSCSSPLNGDAFHNETSFRLQGPGSRRVTLAQPNTWSGNTATSPVEVVFDQAASSRPSGTPANGTFRPNNGNLDDFNGRSPVGQWVLQAGDNASGDPLCVRGYTITIEAR